MLAIAIAAVLFMPVEYRAGAQIAHPHAALQLAWEASNGTPRHHHDARKVIHPCVFAALSPTMPERSWMNGRSRGTGSVDNGASGDIADPSTGIRSTTTALAATLMPWLACLAHHLGAARRLPVGPVKLPAGMVLTPTPPPPKT